MVVHAVVDGRVVGLDPRPHLQVGRGRILNRGSVRALDGNGEDSIGGAVPHANDGRLPGGAPTCLPLNPVAVLAFAAKVGLVNLYWTGEHGVVAPHGAADAVRHQSCGLLRSVQVAGKLRTGDTLAVQDEERDHEPLVQGIGLRSITVPVRMLKYFLHSPQR